MWLRQFQALRTLHSSLQRSALDMGPFNAVLGRRGWALAQGVCRALHSLAARAEQPRWRAAGGEPASSSGRWPSWEGGAAAAAAAALGAAAAAAALGCAAPALCEAPGGGGGAAGGGSGGGGGEVGVREAVASLWALLTEQLHRLEASLPPGARLPRSALFV